MLLGSHKAEFDQHVGRAVVAARGFATDDAGERFDAVVVTYDYHVLVERIGPPVERQQAFTGLGAAHDEIAGDLVGVEDVQRPPAIEGEEIGDVHQGVDRAQADAFQPFLQPFRARAVFHATHQPQGEDRRQPRVSRREIEVHLDRTGEFAAEPAPRSLPSVGRGRRRRGRGRRHRRSRRPSGWG